MGSIDLAGLVRGLLVMIGLSMMLGQYGTLERWARAQAIGAMEWKEPLPYFFGVPGNRRTHQSELKFRTRHVQ